MTTLWLDLETYSETPITHGTHKYAENAEVLLVAYAFDDELVEVMDLTERGSLDSVQMMIDTADKIVIHNSAFDRTVLRHCGVHIPTEKVEDTMVLALAHGCPAAWAPCATLWACHKIKLKTKQVKS
jgi:DNA polymerase bacteriophage-type